MNKETKKILIIMGIAVIFLTIIFSILYYFQDLHNDDCLDKIGEDFCIENNYTSYFSLIDYVNQEDFRCESDYENQRLYGDKKQYSYFYFTNEEWNECLIKESKSFNKLGLRDGEKE